jgi:outer membrane protein assembly factor BamB
MTRLVLARVTAIAALFPSTLVSPAQPAGRSDTARRPIAVNLERRVGSYGTNIGREGLWAGDLGRDGTRRREIVATASARHWESSQYWYVVADSDGQYEQVWISPWYPLGIAALAVTNLDADRSREVVVATREEIQVWDGATRLLERRFHLPGVEYPTELAFADLDGDGGKDVAFCDQGQGVLTFSFATGLARTVRAGSWCGELATGDVDGDKAAEIVIGQLDQRSMVLDGATGAVEWAYRSDETFGGSLALGNLDAIPGLDIVALGGLTAAVRVFSGVERRLVRSFQPSHRASGLTVADMDRDRRPEILLRGDYYGSDLQAYDGYTGAPLWSAPYRDVGALTVNDVDGDAERELVLASGSGSRAHRLRVVNAATRAVEWESADLRVPFRGVAYGDVDADGRRELVHSTFSSEGYERQGRYVVRDIGSGAIDRLGPVLPDDDYWIPMHDLNMADLDNDAALEIVVASGHAGHLICYDGATGVEQWRTASALPLAISSFLLADIDADGVLDAVAVTEQFRQELAEEARLYVFDTRDGALKWSSSELGAYPTGLAGRVAQLDGDEALEVVVQHTWPPYGLSIFDGRTREYVHHGLPDFTAVDVADRDGDGVSELFAAVYGRALYTVDPVAGTLRQVATPQAGPVLNLKVAEITGDGVVDYLYSGDDQRVHIQDGQSGRVVWSSAVLGRSIRVLAAEDFDADGRLEVLVGNAVSGIDIFEVRPRRRYAR